MKAVCPYVLLQSADDNGDGDVGVELQRRNYQVSIGIQKAINYYQIVGRETHELLVRSCIETINPDITCVCVTPLLTNVIRWKSVNRYLIRCCEDFNVGPRP